MAEKLPKELKQILDEGFTSSVKNFTRFMEDSAEDDLNYIISVLYKFESDFESGDMFNTIESICDLATLRQIVQLIEEKYY